jgi:hypothetical protein
MEAATKDAIFSLVETVAFVVGLGFGGWAFVHLIRQHVQKALFAFLAGVTLVSLQKFSEVARQTFSLAGVSVASTVGAQDSSLVAALNSIDFTFAIVGYVFFFRSILLFSRIPDGRARTSDAVVVLLSGVTLVNLGSVLQILLKAMLPA